ncbi:MAG: amidase family protein, partial [Rhodospirillales bacterium]|nr:amidase family protein [Rhodospirillales bacterium]
MNATELCFTPATELAGLIGTKKISPSEVMEAVLARIEALEPRLNAFAHLTADAARAAAREAEDAVVRGAALGPLHGIPVTIKDLTLTAGVPTERGSHAYKGAVPEVDAPMVSRLRDAGAIPLGKTTTSELGWKGVSESPLTGITHNPWKPGFNAGASSAGAGVAAAAGYGPLHQGSDGAGSVRMPSHFCGVFGLKPTFGRIANWPVGNTDNASNIGPLTRTVADAALMLHVMAGPHAWDHTSLEAPPADYPARLVEGIAGLKVAFSADLGHARVDPEVASLVADAVRVFDDLGCAVEPATPGFGPDGPELIRFFWPAHMLNHSSHLAQWEDRMDPGLLACIRAGQGFSAQDYLDARARKLAYVEGVHRFFEDWDLLLTPAVSVAAFPAQHLQPEHWPSHAWDWMMWAEFSYPFNFSGNPAA